MTMLQRFARVGALAVLSLLVASSTVAGEDFTCISLNTEAFNRKVYYRGVTRRTCRTLCRNSAYCVGYHFTKYYPRCTHTFVDGRRSDSKMCLKSAKIREGLSQDRQFLCYSRSTVTVTIRNISEVKCDDYCEGNGNCDSYIYDAKTNRCIAKPRYMVGRPKVFRHGSRRRGDALCHVIPKFQQAFCRCFDKYDLDSAVDEINNGDAIVDINSCSTDSDRDGLELFYKPKDSENLRLFGFGSSADSCRAGDALQSLEDEEEESERCESLIQVACDALDVPVVPPVTCRCFDESDLDLAVDKINSGDVTVDNSSCSTDKARYGLELTYKPLNSKFRTLGYRSFPNGCMEADVVQYFADEEESKYCESLIQVACGALDVPVVPPVTCRCFDESDLDSAVRDINSGDVIVDNSSCSTDKARYGLELTYKPLNSEFKNMLGYRSFPNGCMEGDALQSLEDEEEESERCESLIQNACGALDVPVVPPVTCRCFDEDKLALAVEKINNGTVDIGCNSCSTHSLDGVELTYTPKNSTYYYMLGYGANSESCMSGGDQLFILEDEEEIERCQSLIQNACNTLDVSIPPCL